MCLYEYETQTPNNMNKNNIFDSSSRQFQFKIPELIIIKPPVKYNEYTIVDVVIVDMAITNNANPHINSNIKPFCCILSYLHCDIN